MEKCPSVHAQKSEKEARSDETAIAAELPRSRQPRRREVLNRAKTAVAVTRAAVASVFERPREVTG